MTADDEKRLAAEAAAELVESGMTVGLGTGSTVAHLLPAVARRGLTDLRCVATSVAGEVTTQRRSVRPRRARAGRRWATVEPVPSPTVMPLSTSSAAADRFVVIADSSKPVEKLTWPVPLELFAFGLASTLARLGDDVTLRPDTRPSPDGGLIADYRGPGLDDPAALAARLEADPGVAAQGLFPPSLVSAVFIARGTEVERRTIG